MIHLTCDEFVAKYGTDNTVFLEINSPTPVDIVEMLFKEPDTLLEFTDYFTLLDPHSDDRHYCSYDVGYIFQKGMITKHLVRVTFYQSRDEMELYQSIGRTKDLTPHPIHN